MDLSSLSHLCVKMSKEDEQRKRLSPKHTRTRTQHPALDQSVSNKARHAGASMRAGRDRTSLNRDACAGTRRSRGHSADPRTRRVPLKQPRHDHTPFGVSYGKETEYIDTHAPPTGRFLRHNGAALERRRFEENNNKIPLKAVRSDNHAALCGRLEHQKECTLWVLRNEKTRLTLAQRRRLESTHGPLRSGRCGGFVSPGGS